MTIVWPFELLNGCINAKARFRGKVVRIHVDTGSGATWISDSAIVRLGVPLTRYGKDQKSSLPGNSGYCLIDGLRIGHHKMSGIVAHRLSMHNLKGAPVRDFIIGKEFLEKFHTTIDYPSRRLVLTTRRPPERPTRQGNRFIVKIPFRLSEHLILIRGRIGRRSFPMCIDTGSSGGTISLVTAKKLGLELAKRAVDSHGIEGPLASHLCSVERLRFGKLLIPFQWLHAHDYGHMKLPISFDLLLGGDFLSNFRIGLDYRSRMISFEFEGRKEDKLARPNQAFLPTRAVKDMQ